MLHNIKIKESFCDAICNGDKCFEIRENDRGYQKGDLISFNPVTDAYIATTHEISKKVFEITYVISGWGLKNGYVAFGIREVSPLDCR